MNRQKEQGIKVTVHQINSNNLTSETSELRGHIEKGKVKEAEVVR